MFVLVKCLHHDLTKQLDCSRLVKSDWLNGDLIKGNVQFVQKVTFQPLIDLKQNHYGG